jgi:phosphoribosylglycinamide formyltransferase-1
MGVLCPISSLIVTNLAATGSPGADTGPIVVLVSGSGTNLQALVDASADPSYGLRIAAVGADRGDIEGLARARRAGIPTFVCRVADFATRADWDDALASQVAAYSPRLVVLAGFMKMTGEAFLRQFGGRTVNTHPALLPSFPGVHGPQDALDYGVKLTGCTLLVVDAGIDTGPIVAQRAVEVHDDDTVEILHERIKTAERQMLVDYVGRMVRDGFSVNERKVTIS